MSALTLPNFSERLVEARETRTLSLGYLGLEALPSDLIERLHEFKVQAITSLDLSSNKLSELPDLGKLVYLQELLLKYNFFTRLPPTLLSLPRLEVLELAGNQLTTLDENILAQLPRLKELDVSSNQLTALPDSIVRMPQLQQLIVDHNALDYLPDNIGTCTTLVKLAVGTNRLTALPSSIGLLPRLQRLDASANQLTTVPAALGGIKTLKEFNLRYNNQLEPVLVARSEEGLSKLLGHLREEAERERLAGIEALKPVGTQAGAFLEYRMKADAAQRPSPGEPESTPLLDNRCWVRSGYTLNRVGAKLIILGGLVLHTGQKTVDAFWVTDDRMEWHRQVFTSADKPSVRDGHSCIVDGTKLVLFGGRNHEGRRLNDVWTLDTDTWAWARVPTMGAVPVPRHSAAAAFYSGTMVIFGGSGNDTRLNDVWMLEVRAEFPAWRQMVTGGTGIGLRHSPAYCLFDETLYVHGGFGNFMLGDLFALDLKTLQWRELGPFARAPPKAQGHSMMAHNNYLWLYGITSKDGSSGHSLYRLDLNLVAPGARMRAKPVWEEMDVDLPTENLTNLETTANLLYGERLELCHCKPVLTDSGTQPGAVWNVYRAAALDIFGTKAALEAALPQGHTAKLARLAAYAHEDADRVPPAFSTLSRDEEAMLVHVGGFVDTIDGSESTRMPAFMTPKNECGVQKLICTFIRPMICQHPQLADLDSICSFVADFVLYEPLVPPHAAPASLVSPSTLLQWQGGDSFDMANLLCCLLLGVGYDAFVVMGHAPTEVVQGSSDSQPCPPLPKHLQGNTEDFGTELRTHVAAQTKPDGSYRPTVSRNEKQSDMASAMDELNGAGSTTARTSTADEASEPPLSQPMAAGSQRSSRPASASAPSQTDAQPAAQNQAQSEDSKSTSATPQAASAAEPEKADPENSDPEKGDPAKSASVEPDPAQAPVDAADAMVSNPAQEGEPPAEAAAVEPAQDEPALPSPPAQPAVHAWVLVLAGRREVSQSIFIEPNSGKAYSLDEGPYTDIEAVWNRYNYWVAMPTAHGQEGMAQANHFDLENSAKWSRLLENPAYQHDISGLAAEDMGQTMSTTRRKNQGKASIVGSKLGSRQGSISMLSRSSIASPKPLRDRNVSMAAFATHTLAQASQQMPPAWHIEPAMPASWVLPNAVTCEMVDRRCPSGVRSRTYDRCIRESFAWAGVHARWDGMAERTTLYEDDERTRVHEVREVFQRRMDKLRERRTRPGDGTIQELFDSGAAMAVVSLWTARDGRYEVLHKSRWRHDGLIRRAEIGDGKMIEKFEDRGDGMVHRSARFSSKLLAKADQELGVWASPIHVTNTATAVERQIHRLTERFVEAHTAEHSDSRTTPSDASPSKNSNNADSESANFLAAAARRTFNMPGGDMEVVLHRKPGHLTADQLVLGRKGGLKSTKLVDPLAEPPHDLKLKGIVQDLIEVETQAVLAVREAEREVAALVELRRQQECNVKLAWSYPEADREVAAGSKATSDATQDGPISDYLSSFLPARLADSPSAVMTAAEAKEAKAKCLQALNERLTEREGLIKARRSTMVLSTAERQAKWEKERAHLTPEEAASWEALRKDDVFKLGIIDKRLRHHEKMAIQQQQELASRLQADPRMTFLRA